MKFQIKKIFSIVMLLCLVFTTTLTGCGKKKEATKKNTSTKTVKTVKGPKDSTSVLTGLEVTKEERNMRPYAIMTENTKDAIPQYGLNSASIIYECPVEGGITRLMAIYENLGNMEKVGNVRSCRPYYVYFAAEYDAIYTHFGESTEGADALAKKLTPEINGMSSKGGKSFYRTSDRKAPHNAYTSAAGLAEGAQRLGIDTTYNADEHKHFTFATKDASTGLYVRHQFGNDHIDKVDGKTITVKNIILENVSSAKFSADKGTLNLGVVGSGTGKFITNGKVIDITWKKDSDKAVTHYYDKSGKEIVLNPGKTWISVIENNYAEKNTFE